jgi:hypothetical protein
VLGQNLVAGTGQKRKFSLRGATVSCSAKGDIGLSIDCVRCTRKTGRWIASRS